ncbi:hypothetical protein KY347_01240 [Candidatus Woesearchaeota archaeon]|nr:hypothetical protein [Candidatus Woesearchaeota archaeon]
MLIQETLPKEYNLFTRLIHDSVDKGYKSSRAQRVMYMKLYSNLLIKLMEDILKEDSQKRFLIREEKKFVKFALKLFRNQRGFITIEDYADLIRYSFIAVLVRLNKIKSELTYLIKKNRFDVSNIDNEYYFSLENILQQVESIDKDLKSKNWYKRTDKLAVVNKVLIIYKHLNELAVSIALDDTNAIPNISRSILSFDDIQFNITGKLIS